MTRATSDNERAQVAQRMQERGYCPLLLMPLGKRPVDVGWQDGPPRDVSARLRWNPDKNLGWRMGAQGNGRRLLALDDDGGMDALEAVLGPLVTTWSQTTPSGGAHFVYSVPLELELNNRVRVAGHDVDVRCDRGYIVTAPSELDDRDKQTAGFYVARPAPIAALPERWLAALRAVPVQQAPPMTGPLEPSLERALRYTAQCEPAISGQGGHGATFRVALKAVEFGLSIADTMQVLREFNRRCSPAWTYAELRHKAEQAHGVGRVVKGGKLAAKAARDRASLKG